MRQITLLLILVAGCVSAELCDTEPELREVGRDLAAKAAAFYAEKYFPGSSVGSGEPVYDIIEEGQIVGWYFIIDTNGEETISFREYIEFDARLHKEYLTPLLTNQPFEDLTALTKYNNQIENYKAIYISNYLEHCPFLHLEMGRVIAISGTPYSIKQVCELFNAYLVNINRLCSLPNSVIYAIQFEDNNGNSYYCINSLGKLYYSSDEIDEVITYLKVYHYESRIQPSGTWQDILDSY